MAATLFFRRADKFRAACDGAGRPKTYPQPRIPAAGQSLAFLFFSVFFFRLEILKSVVGITFRVPIGNSLGDADACRRTPPLSSVDERQHPDL